MWFKHRYPLSDVNVLAGITVCPACGSLMYEYQRPDGSFVSECEDEDCEVTHPRSYVQEYREAFGEA